MMFPVVEIKCTSRDIAQKADVLEYHPDRLKVVVQGTEVAIDMIKKNGKFVGRKAGLEFVCENSYEDIDIQKKGR